jgi:hypothetical protein
MNELFFQLIVLLRFLCFIALFYLMLHILVSGIIKRPENKVLWFFSVLTQPLTRPVRAWVAVDMPEQRVRMIALVLYGVLWLVTIALTRMITGLSQQAL